MSRVFNVTDVTALTETVSRAIIRTLAAGRPAAWPTVVSVAPSGAQTVTVEVSGPGNRAARFWVTDGLSTVTAVVAATAACPPAWRDAVAAGLSAARRDFSRAADRAPHWSAVNPARTPTPRRRETAAA